MTRKRWIQIDGKLIDADQLTAEECDAPMVMADIQPYRSMIDGSVISSRSTHRAHLKAHGCIEVGNETKHLKPAPVTPSPGLKETIARVAYEKLRY